MRISLSLKDKELADSPDVRKWLQNAEDILNNEIDVDKMVTDIAMDLAKYGVFAYSLGVDGVKRIDPRKIRVKE